MMETTMRWVIDLREMGGAEPVEEDHAALPLGELLYRVLFGDECTEGVQVV